MTDGLNGGRRMRRVVRMLNGAAGLAVLVLGGLLVRPSAPNAAGDPAASRTAAKVAAPAIHWVNRKAVALDYELLHIGRAGVCRVELWVTRDDGRTWTLFASADDPEPPLTLHFPDEGVYGLRMVAYGRGGRSKGAPKAGDVPDLRVGVDVTLPDVKLFAPRADPASEDRILLTWEATDQNLVPRPITLEWAAQLKGPWQVIAADLANTGRHAWALPKDVPAFVYLRIVARDRAGNRAVAQTRSPVCLDLSQPEVRLRGVRPAAR